MSEVRAKARSRARAQVTVTRSDGRTLDVALDDSFQSWWQTVRWNWTHPSFTRKHKLRMLDTNLEHLFTKVIWRKLRRN